LIWSLRYSARQKLFDGSTEPFFIKIFFHFMQHVVALINKAISQDHYLWVALDA
jgi:hypothetical protein